MLSAVSESLGNDNAEMPISLLRYRCGHSPDHTACLLLHRQLNMPENNGDEAISLLEDDMVLPSNKRQRNLSKVFVCPNFFDFYRLI